MQIDPKIANQYARAVFNIARERGALDKLEHDAELFEAVYGAQKNERIRRFLESPVYLTRDKEALLRKAFADDIGVTLLNVLVMLVRRGRIAYAPAILGEIHELVAEAKGIVKGVVTTAVPIDEPTRERLLAAVKKVAGDGLQLRYRVDSTIIGGVIVQYGDTLIDDSVRTHFHKMRTRLASLDLRPVLAGTAS